MLKTVFCLAIVLLLLGPAAYAQAGKTLFAASETKHFDSLKLFGNWLNAGIRLADKDTAKAFAYLSLGLEDAVKRGDKYAQAYIFRAEAEINRKYKNHPRAFGNFLQTKYLFAQLGDSVELAYATFHVAREQYHRGVYSKAIANYIEAIGLAEMENLPELESEALENLGLLYNAYQIFGHGTLPFRKALEIKKKLKDQKGELRIIEILSEVYYRQRNFDSAWYFADSSLALATRLKRPTEIIMARINKAASLTRLKNDRLAKSEIVEIQRLRENFGADLNLQMHYWVVVGNYFLSRGDTLQSRSYYDSAMWAANKNLIPELQAMVFGNMAESFFESGAYQEAYEYQNKYIKIISSLYEGENAVSLGNLEMVLSNNAAKDEIRYLNAENRIRALQLSHEMELRSIMEKESLMKDTMLRRVRELTIALGKENDYKNKQLAVESRMSESLSRTNELQKTRLADAMRLRMSLIIGLSTAILMGAVILLQYRRQRRKSAIIARQSEEMQVLMKEIHHRVKNNLQVISSLLDLQSLSIHDQEASEAVKESKNRVLSMALIHQNLYSDGITKGISVQEYILNLTKGLLQSYNIQPGSVELETSIDNLQLDVDTVIPLGLVLNELISNSLKYGINGKTGGRLIVALQKEDKNGLILKVHDNGPGFPEHLDLYTTPSFGMKLVRAFAQKLKARLEIYNNQGACVDMHIRKFKWAEESNRAPENIHQNKSEWQ